MPQVSQDEQGFVRFSVLSLAKGAWTHLSPLSTPEGFAPTFTNFDLPGGIPTSMYGDSDFIATAWPAAWGNATLLCKRKIAGSDPTTILAGIGGYVGYWTGAAWVELRNGLSTGGLQWSWVQYGTDLFISNLTDGIYRYDGDTLMPVGAKPIAQAELDEAALWTNETPDAVNFKEGIGSVYVTSGNPGASAALTFTPATTMDVATGRLSARTYAVTKATGSDCFHFSFKLSNGAGSTVTDTTTTFTITDTLGKSLAWGANLWRTGKSTSAAVVAVNDNNWHEVWLFPVEATEVATFNPTLCATFKWIVTTSAGQTNINVEDIYVTYVVTMPAVAYLAEWKNILWGARTTANPDSYFFSKVSGPDEYSGTATNPIKAKGEAITGLANFYNQLTITVDHSVHSLSATNITSPYPAYLFDNQQVTDEAGCSSHHSIVKAINRLWWLYQREMVSYNGTGVVKESLPIDVTLALIDEANLDRTVGAKCRSLNQLWWSYRRSGEGANDRIIRYDYVAGAWLPCEGISTPLLLQSYASGSEKLLTVNNTTRKIKKQADSASLAFSGTNIEGTICLPPMSTDTALQWIEAYIRYLTNTGTLTVAYRIVDSYRALAAAGYTTMEAINQALPGELNQLRIGDQGTVCQIRLTTSGVRAQIQPPITVTTIPLSPGQRYV